MNGATSIEQKAAEPSVESIRISGCRRDFWFGAQLALGKWVRRLYPLERQPWRQGQQRTNGAFNAFMAFIAHATPAEDELLEQITELGIGASRALEDDDREAVADAVRDELLRWARREQAKRKG